MLPNFYGEFFMYNLLSDKLDKFEKEIRRYRNKFFGKTTFLFFNLAHKCFDMSKPYIHTDLLKKFKEDLNAMLADIEEEFDLRRKMSGGQVPTKSDQTLRDSSFAIKETVKGVRATAPSMQTMPQQQVRQGMPIQGQRTAMQQQPVNNIQQYERQTMHIKKPSMQKMNSNNPPGMYFP
jgi:hypothetical protein